MTPVRSADVDRFAGWVRRRFGHRFDEGRREHLADALRAGLAAERANPELYLARLEQGWAVEEAKIAERVTVGETYFFRSRDQIQAFVAGPLRHATERSGAIRVLIAGSSRGDEAYTIAMAIREALPALGLERIRILAVDLNPAALARAREGRCSAWSLRDTDDATRARWFEKDGADFVVAPTIRRMVRFEIMNLADETDPRLVVPEAFDTIFCRNVTMYFEPAVTERLMARFARALAPEGALFLGHAETLRGVSRDFTLCHEFGAFFYRRRAELGTVVEEEPRIDLARAVDASASWVATLQEVASPIAALGPPSDRRPADVAAAIESPGQTPEQRLLGAVLLANGGKADEAEAICRELLLEDDLDAGAHYVLALCREHAGDREGALEEDRVAAYLDPAFAMPHLHRGLLARRGAHAVEARVAFERAADLFATESDARILLFGGGFSRKMLVMLCRAELRAIGGAA